jgi:hypothetical protein
MPSQHRYPPITPRPSPELRERAKQAVAEVDSNLNQHIIGFLRWLVGDTNDLPQRPAAPIPTIEPDPLQPQQCQAARKTNKN